jgi:hypothetical protein
MQNKKGLTEVGVGCIIILLILDLFMLIISMLNKEAIRIIISTFTGILLIIVLSLERRKNGN